MFGTVNKDDWTKRCTLTLLATDDEIIWRAQRQLMKDGDVLKFTTTVGRRVQDSPALGGFEVNRNTTSS